jgi:peptide chain release factor subunit 1
MATAVTQSTLRELAGFRSKLGCALSIYVDLDPSTVPTIPDVKTKLSATLAEAEKEAERHPGTRDCRLALREALEQVRAYWNGDFDRHGANGLAVFVSADEGLFRALPLLRGVGDRVRIDAALWVAPLVSAVEHEGTLVAVVSRERGTVYRVDGGTLREIADETEEQHGMHHQGGWSQARYQRHIEHLVHQHLKTVGGELDRRARDGRARLVMVAPEEMKGELESALSAEARAAVIGWTTAEAHAGPPELLAVVRPLLDEARAREVEDTLERWQDELGRGARATGGWEDTLEAASDGRVETLLLAEGAAGPEAWECPNCGRASAQGGECPFDGAAREARPDAADLATHHVIAGSGDVVHLARETLAKVGGVGALLRF